MSSYQLSKQWIQKALNNINVPIMMPENWDPNKAEIYYEEFFFKDTPYILPMINLKTRPCSWYLKTGGCTMCGYHLASTCQAKISRDNLFNQFKFSLNELEPISKYPLIHITSTGSFWDPMEVPDDVRKEIFRTFQKHKLQTVITETRPEFVKKSSLEQIKEIYTGNIFFGIGLESCDDYIRNVYINKGFSIKQYEKAIRIITDLELSFANHVLLGKPFLSPKEDLEDVVNTINYTFDVGAELAILMVSHLHKNTLTMHLFQLGLYKLPSLWAIIEVLEKISPKDRSKVVVKGIDKMFPEPFQYATSCERCRDELRAMIEDWNQNKEFQLLLDAKTLCPCRDEWLLDFQNNDGRSLRQKIKETLILS